MTFSLLCPTRNRPQFLVRLYSSLIETADHPEEIELIVFIDDDDNSYDEIQLPGLIKIKEPRRLLAECWNRCYEEASGDYLQLLGDDVLFRTPHWDTIVKEKIDSCPNKIGFVYGDDGCTSGKDFGTHGFIHRNWAMVTGYFVPPYFSAGWVDYWLDTVSRDIGQKHYIDIYTEHMHVGFDKAPDDDTYRSARARDCEDHNADIFKHHEPERQADIAKLKQFAENGVMPC